MKSTNIGIVMPNDEREHVWRENNAENMRICQEWANLVRENLKNVDGTTPEVIVASKTITSVRVAQEIGEELARANCKQVIMLYNVWNFPFLAWPFLNSLGKVPILSLSNNNGQFPGNVGLLATDGALRQAGIRTHRIVGNIDDKETQRPLRFFIIYIPHYPMRPYPCLPKSAIRSEEPYIPGELSVVIG